MSWKKYLEDLGIYDSVEKHDVFFLKLCVEKLKGHSFATNDIIEKNIDRQCIVYAYTSSLDIPFLKSPPAPTLEHRKKLIRNALARMVDEELLERQLGEEVSYIITEKCLKAIRSI